MRRWIVLLLLVCFVGMFVPQANAVETSWTRARVRRQSRVRKAKRYKHSKAKWGKTRHTSRARQY